MHTSVSKPLLLDKNIHVLIPPNVTSINYVRYLLVYYAILLNMFNNNVTCTNVICHTCNIVGHYKTTLSLQIELIC